MSLAACLCAGLLGAAQSGVVSQPRDVAWQSRPGQPDRVRLRLEILQTERTGPTGRLQSTTERRIAVGGTTTLYGVAGRGTDDNLCQAAFVRDPAANQPAYSWQIDATVVTTTATETVLDLRWSRSHRKQEGLQQEVEESIRVTLTPGDYRLLDYVQAAADSPSACSSLALRIQAEPRAPQAAIGPAQTLTYDVWLAYDGKTEPRSIRQHATADSGHAVLLTFQALKWSARGDPVPVDYDGLALGLDVGGSVRATLRPDGLLDVSLDVTRGFQWGQWKSRGGGRQDFRCAVDEPVEIILPDPPAGEASTPTPKSWTGATADGVIVRGDHMTVAPARFLSGGRMSLFVVIHREPQRACVQE